jgi:hypothetical protein
LRFAPKIRLAEPFSQATPTHNGPILGYDPKWLTEGKEWILGPRK